jgi:hypothetical protein
LERIGVICSVSEAEAIFKSHSKTRDGYLQYDEFRELMRNFNPSFLDVTGNHQASGPTHKGFIATMMQLLRNYDATSQILQRFDFH